MIVIECGASDWEGRKKYLQRHGCGGRYVRIKKDDGSLWILAVVEDMDPEFCIQPDDGICQLARVMGKMTYESGQTRRISTGKAWAPPKVEKEERVDDGYVWKRLSVTIAPETLAQRAQFMGVPYLFGQSYKPGTKRATASCKVEILEGMHWTDFTRMRKPEKVIKIEKPEGGMRLMQSSPLKLVNRPQHGSDAG
jgi:hypothetical protein